MKKYVLKGHGMAKGWYVLEDKKQGKKRRLLLALEEPPFLILWKNVTRCQ